MKSQKRAADLTAQSAQQLKIAAMSYDERKTFAATKEDVEQKTADMPAVMQRQVLVIQKAPRTAEVPLLQYIETTVDVPPQKTARGLHNEVQRNPDGQKDVFSIAHDREQ